MIMKKIFLVKRESGVPDKPNEDEKYYQATPDSRRLPDCLE